MLKIKNFIFFSIFALILGCSSIPQNTSNSCSIFNERYLWYKHAKSTEKKWGTPIYVQLAIIKMESDFDWSAVILVAGFDCRRYKRYRRCIGCLTTAIATSTFTAGLGCRGLLSH